MAGVTPRTAARIAGRVVSARLREDTELKTIDAVFSGNVVSGAPTVHVLNPIPEGTSFSQRLGLEIRSQSLRVQIRLQSNAANPATGYLIRHLVFQDRMQQGVTPPLYGVATALFNSATPPTILTPPSPLQRERYHILLDQVHSISAGSALRAYREYFWRINSRIDFLGTGTASADFGPGSYFSVFITEEAADGPLCSFWSRMTFIDP